jgi:hypothetical protein
MRLARTPIWLIAAVVLPLALATSTVMALRAVASGEAPTLRAALLSQPPGPDPERWRPQGWRRDWIADSLETQHSAAPDAQPDL